MDDPRSFPGNPFEMLIRSQEIALAVAADTLRAVRATATAGAAAPDELLRQVTELSSAVTGLAGSTTGLAGSMAQPMQDFLVRQRELAETVARFAAVQSELSAAVADFAEQQAATVAAMERVAGPFFSIMGTSPTETRRADAD